MQPDPQHLLKLVRTEMPFGKYKGRLLIDLPEHYVIWMYNHALPAGDLGQLIAEVYEIKVNGLEEVVRPLKYRRSLK